MRTDLVQITEGGLPNRPSMVSCPDALYGAILDLEDPFLPAFMRNRGYPPAIKVMAETALAELLPLAAPVSETAVHLWLAPLVAATANPRGMDSVEGWLNAMVLAMAGEPIGAFTVETQRRALREMKFWPTPADVWEIVKHDARDIRRRIENLKIIAGIEDWK